MKAKKSTHEIAVIKSTNRVDLRRLRIVEANRLTNARHAAILSLRGVDIDAAHKGKK